MADDRKLPTKSTSSEVDAFLRKVAATPALKSNAERGRLIFAMDATASREPTWDQASHIQGQMFQETEALGGLDIQLCFYRGFAEFNASAWYSSARELLGRMTSVFCAAGQTQIARVLEHAIGETKIRKVHALVMVGDCMEENVDRLGQLAGELGLLGVPVFLFQEGHDPVAERAFRHMAKLTSGAYCRFHAGSADQLRDLLSAVAVFAAGGRPALEDFGRRRGSVVRQLTHQISKG
ncbi:MAG: VWA domain-containing protein [Gammaproteobacteria bacterium]|nr:VWA domain-containing protein [Gammaproteobacteria bacterium]MDJ0873140.1 VWA domain-containing protein [Gammaproteobacteria bacterium]MDJ0891846.1 VWA domain-containing protein [Gammaproteobacteria bacterium]